MNEDLPLIMESVNARPGGLLMEYGLPKSEVLKVCKEMYKNDVIKLTLQISDPVAMQLNKNMKATVMDQIGTVGKFQFIIPMSFNGRGRTSLSLQGFKFLP